MTLAATAFLSATRSVDEGNERTIREHNEEDDESKGPFENQYKGHKGNENIDEGRNDIEKNELYQNQVSSDCAIKVTHFQSVIDGCTSVQHTQDFSSLSASVPGKGQVENMIESQLGHL